MTEIAVHLRKAGIDIEQYTGVMITESKDDQVSFAHVCQLSCHRKTISGLDDFKFKFGRDLIMEWYSRGNLVHVPLVMENIVDITYGHHQDISVEQVEAVFDPDTLVNIIIGQPQLIITTKRQTFCFGQSDYFIQTVCETIIARNS